MTEPATAPAADLYLADFVSLRIVEFGVDSPGGPVQDLGLNLAVVIGGQSNVEAGRDVHELAERASLQGLLTGQVGAVGMVIALSSSASVLGSSPFSTSGAPWCQLARRSARQGVPSAHQVGILNGGDSADPPG